MLEATITFSDGETMQIGSDRLSCSNCLFSSGSTDSVFPIGQALQKTAQIELDNTDAVFDYYNFDKAKIEFTLDGEDFGVYQVDDPDSFSDVLTLTCSDYMYKADKKYKSSLKFPQTAQAVFEECCTKAGLEYVSSMFTNSDYVIKNKPTGYTIREVFGFLAFLAHGNAVINNTGLVEIRSYDPNTVIELEDIVSTTIRRRATQITGFETDSGTVGEEGYVLDLENPFEDSTIIQEVLEDVGTFVFHGFSAELVYAPNLKFMDFVTITDDRGRTWNSFITQVDFDPLGYTSIKNNCQSSLTQERHTGSGAGPHVSTLEDGHYLYDGATLDDSNWVMKIDDSGNVKISTDGGQTWKDLGGSSGSSGGSDGPITSDGSRNWLKGSGNYYSTTKDSDTDEYSNFPSMCYGKLTVNEGYLRAVPSVSTYLDRWRGVSSASGGGPLTGGGLGVGIQPYDFTSDFSFEDNEDFTVSIKCRSSKAAKLTFKCITKYAVSEEKANAGTSYWLDWIWAAYNTADIQEIEAGEDWKTFVFRFKAVYPQSSSGSLYYAIPNTNYLIICATGDAYELSDYFDVAWIKLERGTPDVIAWSRAVY